MVGLDTNVIIRYITQDDPDQSKIATAFIERYCTVDNPGYINQIVLCEIVWVLTGKKINQSFQTEYFVSPSLP